LVVREQIHDREQISDRFPDTSHSRSWNERAPSGQSRQNVDTITDAVIVSTLGRS
jgi:hypothetical protein